MEKSFKLEVRMGDIFKISRTIRRQEDAKWAIEDVKRKLENIEEGLDLTLTWNIDGMRNWAVVRDYITNIYVVKCISDSVLVYMRAIGMIEMADKKPAIDNVDHLGDKTEKQRNMEMIEATPVTESEAIADNAWEIVSESKEIGTLCSLLFQSVMRWEDMGGLKFITGLARDGFFDALEMIERRSNAILETGGGLLGMAEAAYEGR
jgi:hypothetical protein